MFTPRPFDWDSQPAKDDGEWDFVGDEGRRNYEREKDPDGWYKKYLMSDKANAIERVGDRWLGAADPRSEGAAIAP